MQPSRGDSDPTMRIIHIGKIRYTHDFRGGGRSSARETVSRVVAGAICRQWLDTLGVSVCAELLPGPDVDAVAARGDSVGGAVRCVVTGLPVGVGEPVYDKLNARLAAAMMSINAVKAFETGDGVASSALGSGVCGQVCENR